MLDPDIDALRMEAYSDNRLLRSMKKAKSVAGVYVVAAHLEGPCKIGVADDLALRLSGLQCGNWNKLTPAAHAYFGKPAYKSVFPDEILISLNASAYALEAACHRVLIGMDMGLGGEWFAVTVQEAIATIEKTAKNMGLVQVKAAHIESAKWLPDSPLKHKLLLKMAANAATAKAGLAEIIKECS